MAINGNIAQFPENLVKFKMLNLPHLCHFSEFWDIAGDLLPTSFECYW